MIWKPIDTIPRQKCLVLTRRMHVITAIPDADGSWCILTSTGWEEVSIANALA